MDVISGVVDSTAGPESAIEPFSGETTAGGGSTGRVRLDQPELTGVCSGGLLRPRDGDTEAVLFLTTVLGVPLRATMTDSTAPVPFTASAT
jgi:hypothetical protein